MSAFLNNQFLPDAEARLHISDLSMQRGYAVFDFFRTVNAKPFFQEEHLNRLYQSAKEMHLQMHLNKDEVKEIIQHLIQESQLKEAGIRLMLTGGYAEDGYHISKPNFIITCNPVQTSSLELFEKGITAITYEHQRELPQIKSINYLMAVWLHPLLKEKGVDDVLYHQQGMISEFPRANIFIVTREGKLITPAQNILHGITRNRVLKMASAFMPVEERDITVAEVETAAEVFLTSTTRRVIPVLKLNDFVIGNGKPGYRTRVLWDELLQTEKAIG